MAISKTAAKKLQALYLDENIVVYLRDMNVVTFDEQQGEVKITAMAQGYCVDVDTEFFYLGLPDGSITRTISHDLAQMVEIEFIQNDFLLEDMPSADEDVH